MAHSLTAGKAWCQMFMRKGPENQDVTVELSLKWRNGALSYSRKDSMAKIFIMKGLENQDCYS